MRLKDCLQSGGLGLILVLAGCGGEKSLHSDPPIPYDHPAAEVVYNQQLQEEIVGAMEEAQLALIKALLPEADVSQMRTLTASRGIRGMAGEVSCSPDFDFILVGVDISFPVDPSCTIGGDIQVTFIPMKAKVDLAANNLAFLKTINFDAELDLSGGNLDIVFLDGGISLFESSVVNLGDLVINGKVSVQIGGGFALSGRTNVFDRGTGVGATLSTNLGGSNPSGVQACFLSGGDPMDPEAGDASRCFGLGG